MSDTQMPDYNEQIAAAKTVIDCGEVWRRMREAGDKNEANVRKVDTVDTDEAAEAFHRRASKYASGFRYAGGEVDLALQSAVAQAYIEGYRRESALRAQSAAPVPLTPPTDEEVEAFCEAHYGEADWRYDKTDDVKTYARERVRDNLAAFIASRGKGNQK